MCLVRACRTRFLTNFIVPMLSQKIFTELISLCLSSRRSVRIHVAFLAASVSALYSASVVGRETVGCDLLF